MKALAVQTGLSAEATRVLMEASPWCESTGCYLLAIKGCPNPVLEDCNPAGFSVLPAKENAIPGESVVCLFGQESLAGFWLSRTPLI